MKFYWKNEDFENTFFQCYQISAKSPPLFYLQIVIDSGFSPLDIHISPFPT